MGTETKSTAKGLKVEAVMDNQDYQTGIRASKKDMEQLSINKDYSLGKLVYTIEPRHNSQQQSLNCLSAESISNLICEMSAV